MSNYCPRGHWEDGMKLPCRQCTIESLRAEVETLRRERDELLALLPTRTAGGFISFGKYYAEQERSFAPSNDKMAKFKHKYLDQCEAAIAKVKP